MIVNNDGSVTITNNQTGEQRTVDPGQLASFSPLLMNQYIAYMSAKKALDKGSGSGGSTDTGLVAPDNSVIQGGGSNNSQSTTDLSGLSQFAKPVQSPKPQAPKVIITGLSGNNPMGNNTLVTQPVQTPQQQPKNPQKLSTFDINRVNFGG